MVIATTLDGLEYTTTVFGYIPTFEETCEIMEGLNQK